MHVIRTALLKNVASEVKEFAALLPTCVTYYVSLLILIVSVQKHCLMWCFWVKSFESLTQIRSMFNTINDYMIIYVLIHVFSVSLLYY